MIYLLVKVVNVLEFSRAVIMRMDSPSFLSKQNGLYLIFN